MHIKWCGCFDVICLKFLYGNLLSFLILYTSFRMDRWNFLQTIEKKPISRRTKSIGTFRSNLRLWLLYSNDNLTSRNFLFQNRLEAYNWCFLLLFSTERWNKSVRLRPGQGRSSGGSGVLRGLHLSNGKTLHAGSWKGAYTETVRGTDCNIP